MEELYENIDVMKTVHSRDTDVMFGEDIQQENFYFIFEFYIESLEHKMFRKVNLGNKLKNKYSIIYKQYKITYLRCINNKLLIIDFYKAGLDDFVNSMY